MASFTLYYLLKLKQYGCSVSSKLPWILIGRKRKEKKILKDLHVSFSNRRARDLFPVAN